MQVIFLSGYLSSGKGTCCDKYFKNYMRIGVSGIIKNIIGKSTRKELQDTAHLDQEVILKLIEVIEGNFSNHLIIDGIRQPSIYIALQQYLVANNIAYECVWLQVPIEVCKKRFEYRKQGTDKENISFEQAFDRDKDLGLLQLEQLWKENECAILKNY